MTVKKILPVMLIGFFLWMFCGCAARLSGGTEDGVYRQGVTQQGDAMRASAEKYRSLAIAYEKDRQYYKAAFLWLVVQQLNPGDRQALKKIPALEERIRAGVKRHLAQGREYARQKSYESARNEFLMTLAYDPNCREALDWLRHHDENDGYTVYETKQGDTVRSVAQSVYSDPGKDFIVVYFTGTKDGDDFKPQSLLRLPVIEAQLFHAEPKPRHVYQPPPSPRAQKASDKAGAEEHYRKGVAFFVSEDIPRAIQEWEAALDCDPDHANARRNLEKARKILRYGRGK